MFYHPSSARAEVRQPSRRQRYPTSSRSHQPISSIPISNASQDAYHNASPPHSHNSSPPDAFEQYQDQQDLSASDHLSRHSFSSSSVSSFGSVSHVRSPLPPPTFESTPLSRDSRPRLAAVAAPSARNNSSHERSDISWTSRDALHYHDDSPPRVSIPFSSHSYTPPSPPSTARPSWLPHINTARSLPDLRNIRPHAPDVVAARRRLEDNSTKPFSLDYLPFTDHDVPLPQPYNAAYPHPLTAYASPGVNSAAIHAVQWREKLARMMETDLDLVKGTILAASDRDINPPALMIPVYEGEGCGIPERLWSRFESMGEGTGGPSQQHSTSASSSIPPRFVQAGIQVVSTPGGRSTPSSSHSFPSSATDSFPAVRTNFSNVLRRASVDVDSGRGPLPARRGSVQPTPFHKTELCRTWEHEGTCKYGLNCQFAHGLLELRMPVTSMQTPPIPTHPLGHRTEESSVPSPARGSTYDRSDQHQPRLPYIGENSSPIHQHPYHQARTTTPSPIGAERERGPWRTVPVPLSSSTRDPYPTLPARDILFEAPYSSAPIIAQRKSTSSLSASAASFQTTSSSAYSHSSPSWLPTTSPSSQYRLNHRRSLSPPVQFLGVHVEAEADNDGDAPDWEGLKRSIDAATVRSVWDE